MRNWLQDLDVLAADARLRQAGWDTYSAAPLTDAAVEAARRFLRFGPSIVPTPSGGIHLEWHGADLDLAIEFDDAGHPVGAFAQRASDGRHLAAADEGAVPAAPLFQRGAFILHSGEPVGWKIDCDALTDTDMHTLAELITARVGPFGAVEGVPRGGTRLASWLAHYQTAGGPLLIVDDVLTTGSSMDAHRAGREAIGAVIFARGQCPPWITPLFHMAATHPVDATLAAPPEAWLLDDAGALDIDLYREKGGGFVASRRSEQAPRAADSTSLAGAVPAAPLRPERLDAAVAVLEALQARGYYLHDERGRALDTAKFIEAVTSALKVVGAGAVPAAVAAPPEPEQE